MEFTPEMLSKGNLPMYPKGSIVFFSKNMIDNKDAINDKDEDIIIGKIFDEYKLNGNQVYDIFPYDLRTKRFNESVGYLKIRENKILRFVDIKEKMLFYIEENFMNDTFGWIHDTENQGSQKMINFENNCEHEECILLDFKVDMKTSQIRPGNAIDDLKED